MTGLLPDNLNEPDRYEKKQSDYRRGQRKKATRGTGYRVYSLRDNANNMLKNALQTYTTDADAERLAGSVLGLLFIENINIDHLAAALYIYDNYKDELGYRETLDENDLDFDPNRDNGIRSSMFKDSSAVMKKIREIIERSPKSNSEKKSIWIQRKVVIFTYLNVIIDHYARETREFSYSHAFKKERGREKEQGAKEEEEVEEEIDDDLDGTGNDLDYGDPANDTELGYEDPEV